MKTSSISKFVILLSVSILFLSFGIQDIPVPGKNKVAVGNTRVSLVERELVVDYQLRFGQNVASCDVDVIVLVDDIPYRFTKYYSGDFGRQSSPGSKQLRLKVSPKKELLSSRDIKFRIDVVRTELKDGKVFESSPMFTMPEVLTSYIKQNINVAECGGTVLYDGGASVTQRGVVWSTYPNPTVSLSTEHNDGTGEGCFSSLITGLRPSTKYYVRAYATNAVGTSYGNEVTFTTENIFAEAKDLSGSSSANCYIVSERGIYKYRTVKGNSSTSVGNVAKCEVLWESFGTSTTPSIGDLIKSVTYFNGYIGFETATTFREGNAVIAAKDANGTILWSWHIWLTDQPQGQTYNNGAGVMMDRNLGAISSTPGDAGALSLLYQWGRKDPFLGFSSINDDIEAKSTITWPSPVETSANTGTIAFATANPTTFIFGNGNTKYEWYYKPKENSLWQSFKTIYDPCPPGWRVPDGGRNGVWANAFGTSDSWDTTSNWDSINKGMDFSKTDKKLGSSGPIWYPASGYRSGSSGFLYDVGSNGNYWSVSPDGYYACYLYFSYNGCVNPASSDFRADGQSVRCLQE